jgi:hypothetical protein
VNPDTVWHVHGPTETIEGLPGLRIDTGPERLQRWVLIEIPGRKVAAVEVLGADRDGWAVVVDPLREIDLRERGPEYATYPAGPIGLTTNGRHRGYQIDADLPTGALTWVTIADDEWLAKVLGCNDEGYPIVGPV